MKRIALFFLISIVSIIIGAILISTVSGEQISPKGEEKIQYMYQDLVVEKGTAETWEGETLIMNGAIRVEGTLVLRNATIYMNSSYNGEYGIHVLPSGELRIEKCSIVQPSGEKHYTFRVSRNDKDHGILSITDSSIIGAGYFSTLPENTGLYLESKKVTIARSTFSANHIGMIFKDVNGDIHIEDSHFNENDKAMVIDGSSGITIRGSEFQDNERAILISRSDLIELKSNSFFDNDHAVRVDNSSDLTILENTFKGNHYSGINIEFSTDCIVEDNQIAETRSHEENILGTGIILRRNSHADVLGNSLLHNDIGLMMIHNNSETLLDDTVIKGGKLGIYLYDEHYPNDFRKMKITETKEAAFNMKHSSDQVFHDMTLITNHDYELNVTSSFVEFIFPEFDEMDYFVDGKSTVLLSSGMKVHAMELSGFALSGSDVLVSNDGSDIYATEGYGGTDPLTDEIGMTDWIPVEYIIIDDKGTNLCRIDISVRWKDQEITSTSFGEIEEIERFYFRIPDLTISNTDIIIVPSEPRDNEGVIIASTLTNLGTSGVETNVSVYQARGLWDKNAGINGGMNTDMNAGMNIGMDVDVPADEFSLPFNAELIESTTVSVKSKEKKTIEIAWLPGTAGDYTIVTIIDREMEILELRKDNNIAYTHISVKQGEIEQVEHAVISLVIPESLNNSNVSSSLLSLTLTLRNDGLVRGSVILMGTVYQYDETILFLNDIYTVDAGEEIQLQIQVKLNLGEVILNLTLLQQIGEDTLELVTPYLSLTLHVREGPGFQFQGDNDPIIPGVVLYSSVAAVISFCFAFVAFAESARYRFFLLFVPLYMRMSKKDIVEHYIRGEILGYIKQNPGESYNNIKRDLQMSNGKLAYHLSVLEKGGFIKSVTDGMYRRYYPRKSKVTTYGRITSIQENILRRIEETPGISQKDLSKIVNLSTATINYHIRKLASKGLITSKRTGIFIHYYLEDLTVEEIMKDAISSSRRASVKQ